MLRNYLAAALRNLVRNGLYAAINVTGLAVGFAAALLIALFVRDELTYDRWLPGHDRLYRVSGYAAFGETKQPQDSAPRGVAAPLLRAFPEIEALAQISYQDLYSLRKGDIESMERLFWASANFFDVVQLPVVAGDLRAALTAPDSIVMTRSAARKYFGEDAPLGQTIEIDRKFLMRVTAVIEDLPSNTHLDLGIIAPAHAPNSGLNAGMFQGDISYPMFVYVRLTRGASVQRMREALPALNEKQSEFTTPRRPYWLDAIVPIADIHLRPPALNATKPAGSRAMIYSAIAIAALIVVIAGINFVNLTTARAAGRCVEVGVRKVSGAVKRQLIAQFIGESLFYATLGIAAAFVLASSMLPPLNAFLERTMALDLAKEPVLPAAILAVVLLVGSAAGAYPAVLLSRFSPAAVLKRAPLTQKTRSTGRQVLVAVQFAVLIALTLVATAITQQARYTSTAALRLNTDQVLIVQGGALGACPAAFLAGLRQLPGVQGATCINGPILGGPTNLMEVEGPDGTKVRSQMLLVDFDSFDVYGLAPRAGRFFSPDYGGDAAPLDGGIALGQAVVINETLARGLGFSNPQDALGKTVRYTPTIARNATEKRPDAIQEIVGVAPDFGANRDLRQSTPPRVFFIEPDSLYPHGSAHVKLAGQQIPETLTAIDDLWKKVGPAKPIERVFLNQTIQGMYRAYTRQGETVAMFAAVAVFISCLGLFGLAAYAAEQRTKEIGVRKAMGAGSIDIVRMMLWHFSKPVLWGSLIAWPVSYVLTRRWLENFADRIDLAPWMFIGASGLALAIALLTVIGHALLVARAQPVKALRYE